MIKVYGYTNKEGVHFDTSKTLHGAKCYATRNNINNISIRYGYNVVNYMIKENNNWITLLTF